MTTSLSVDEMSKDYRGRTALDHVSMEFGPGVTAILGPNGAGKTTLVRILVGAMEANQGHVSLTLDGSRVSDRRSFARNIGWLPQFFGFPGHMRVRDFVRYAAWLKEVERGDATTAVENALAMTDTADAANERMEHLSGGTLRRVGLAAALVHRPRVLVLDEPTAGLDPIQRANFHATVHQYAPNATVILATHLLEDVSLLADSIHVLARGRRVWSGSTDELQASSASGHRGIDGLRAGFTALVEGARP